ncbi:TetR family transcriptional regulator [uncultured Pantoea sp.]|uniref:TetR family transcriptional regulator n=1 Tax=uncultured Pantoea sp. TaxID=218084 RepID=UPI000344D6DE|nr:TetR family transcriptional regulator [uncultured Pantoea sp.]
MQLREDLIDAAYRLFVEKGVDNTTVKDITDLVNVSSRTFFRYFSCKEDVILNYQIVEYEEIIIALAERPKSEPILTALRRASVAVTKGCEEGAFGIDPKRFKTLRDLIRNHPLMKAKNAEILQTKKQGLTTLIAQKMGVDPLKDIRPHTIAAILEFVYSSAYDIWKERESEATYYDVLDDVFSLIEEGINHSCVS